MSDGVEDDADDMKIEREEEEKRRKCIRRKGDDEVR